MPRSIEDPNFEIDDGEPTPSEEPRFSDVDMDRAVRITRAESDARVDTADALGFRRGFLAGQERGVREAREACAKMVSDECMHLRAPCDDCPWCDLAAAIRARGDK